MLRPSLSGSRGPLLGERARENNKEEEEEGAKRRQSYHASK